MHKRFLTVLVGISLLLVSLISLSSSPRKPENYLYYVETFARTLLDKGLDQYGNRKTAMWGAVIDSRTQTVPQAGVPVVEGIRPTDRAVGGSNYYHDVVTVKVLHRLSEVTGKQQFSRAADAYTRDFLQLTQSSQTGLLGWGEHLYYDVFEDRVRVPGTYAQQTYGGMWHEFLSNTPPWEDFWNVDSVRTAKAIAGIRYHFLEPDPKTFLFNRHAHWDTTRYQKPGTAQPWIKHSGLYAYSFAFLHQKTGQAEWEKYTKGIGSLYWDHRNTKTNLTLVCIGDPRPTSGYASLSGIPLLSYYLLKASQVDPEAKELRNQAVAMLKSIDRYSWNPEAGAYYSSLTLDGKPTVPESGQASPFLKAWVSGYGTLSLLTIGRVAAYFARSEKDGQFLEMAKRTVQITRKEPLPDHFVAENMADAIQLSLDLYELTGDKAYLADARKYADLSIAKLYKNGLFVRQTNDDYYEAKLGAGDLVAGLLRLHLTLHPGKKQAKDYDWSL